METYKRVTVIPDVIFFDGNGYLHPRHMGLATHAGILIQKATVGVAKSYYKVGDVVRFTLGYGGMLKAATSAYVERDYIK